MKYFAITKKLREAEPDSLDMALMCALSILTCDRGVPMPRSAVKKLYAIQVRLSTFKGTCYIINWLQSLLFG